MKVLGSEIGGSDFGPMLSLAYYDIPMRVGHVAHYYYSET